MNIKARRAVVLTTAALYDDELKEALPGWRWVFMGNPTTPATEEDGHRAGAALGHMYQRRSSRPAPRACGNHRHGMRIWSISPHAPVDNYGKRYINEVFTSVDPQRYQFYNEVIVYDILGCPILDPQLAHPMRRCDSSGRPLYGAHAGASRVERVQHRR